MLQVTVGVGMPSAWQSSRTVSPGAYSWFWGSFTQYGAATNREQTATGYCCHWGLANATGKFPTIEKYLTCEVPVPSMTQLRWLTVSIYYIILLFWEIKYEQDYMIGRVRHLLIHVPYVFVYFTLNFVNNTEHVSCEFPNLRKC